MSSIGGDEMMPGATDALHEALDLAFRRLCRTREEFVTTEHFAKLRGIDLKNLVQDDNLLPPNASWAKLPLLSMLYGCISDQAVEILVVDDEEARSILLRRSYG